MKEGRAWAKEALLAAGAVRAYTLYRVCPIGPDFHTGLEDGIRQKPLKSLGEGLGLGLGQRERAGALPRGVARVVADHLVGVGHAVGSYAEGILGLGPGVDGVRRRGNPELLEGTDVGKHCFCPRMHTTVSHRSRARARGEGRALWLHTARRLQPPSLRPRRRAAGPRAKHSMHALASRWRAKCSARRRGALRRRALARLGPWAPSARGHCGAREINKR